MAQNFDLFFRRVIDDEGISYEDVAGDNGGPTKCGITIADVARWNGVKCPARGGKGWDDLVQKVRALTPQTAGLVYKKYYWDAVRADDLAPGLDYAVVDYAVNSGVGRAVPTLGRLVGIAKAKIVDDAVLAAIGQYGHLDELINHFQDERKNFLEQIAEIPHNRKFRRGWLEREARVRKVALELAHQAAPAIAVAAPKAKAMEASDTASAPASVMQVAAGSKTLWTLIMGAITTIANYFSEQLEQAWEWLLWLLGVIPSISAEVKDQIDSSEQLANWLKLDWKTISLGVVLACLAVAFIRHLNDKRKLPNG